MYRLICAVILLTSVLNCQSQEKMKRDAFLSAKTDESKAHAMFVAEPSLKAFKNKKYKKGEKEKLVKIIKEQMALGERLGVRGTPTLFSVKGKSVVWSSLLEKYNIK